MLASKGLNCKSKSVCDEMNISIGILTCKMLLTNKQQFYFLIPLNYLMKCHSSFMNNMYQMMLNSKSYVMVFQTCNNYKTYKIIKQAVQFLKTQKALHSNA